MIKLTKRQNNIVEILLEQTKPISIENLSNQLTVSQRTIRYDLKNVEYYFKFKNIVLSKKPNVGIWLDIDEKNRAELKKEISILEPYDRVLTATERQDIIVLCILLSDKPVSSQFIADEIQISRNTVISDLKNIKLQLAKYDLELESKPKHGFHVVGSEFNIRKILNNLIQIYVHENELIDISYILNDSKNKSIALKFFNEACRNIKISDIKGAIKECKKIYDFWIPDTSYRALLIDLMIIVKRAISNNKIEFSNSRKKPLKELQEYKVAKVILQYLSNIYKVCLNEDEIVYLTYSLFNNDFKLKDISQVINKKDEETLKNAVNKMIKTATKHISLSGESIERLSKNLLSHMCISLKKYRINAENKNPLLEEIKKNYSEEFLMAKEMLESFSSVINIEQSDDEIGYIAIILAAELEGQKKKEGTKAIIVCSTGRGSAKILHERIKNTIPELQILGTFSVFELEDYPELLKHTDVIISTVYFKTEDKPLIKVSPFISGSDISKIKSFIYEGKKNIYGRQSEHEENMLGSLMEAIDKYIDVDKRDKVKVEIGNRLNSLYTDFITASYELENYEKYSEKTAMTIIEMGEMLNDLYEHNITQQKDLNLHAITIHIVMAIPRWMSGDYTYEIDLEKYKNENPDMFEIIKKHLDYISEKYNLNVPETEVVSLMRYLF